MSKLRLDINSTDVLGTHGIVNIVFNGTNLATSKQLSATVESLEYDVDVLTSGDNVLKIALLNDQAHDANNDGDFNDPVDKTMQAIVRSLSYAVDNVNFTTLLPQAATSYTVPSGPYAGNILILTESVTTFVSYGSDYAITFNSDGIVNTTYCSGLRGKILANGNYQNLLDGKTYDLDGNEVSAP
jgi:hypothetical protein